MQLFYEVLLRFGRAHLRVWGTSMIPTIWPGEILEIVHVDPQSLQSGDIILFERSNRLFCHRLQEVLADSELHFRTRGDSLDVDDPLVPAGAVLGRLAPR
jgi:signal peptidase I